MRLLATLVMLLAGCAARPRLRPFATDGCSLFPDGVPGRETLWLVCCVEHDRKYWAGGTKEDRLKADGELQGCVAATGRPRTAAWMFAGTRAGGTPYLPAGFRWGYGWPYPRGYAPLTAAEKKLVDESPRSGAGR